VCLSVDSNGIGVDRLFFISDFASGQGPHPWRSLSTYRYQTSCFPRLVRLGREGVIQPVDGSTDSALEGFLRTQYYACKASIYWPAVYQAIEFGEADNDLLTHCQKFFHSFVQFMASVEAAIHSCRAVIPTGRPACVWPGSIPPS
jgi:hypothetical protein